MHYCRMQFVVQLVREIGTYNLMEIESFFFLLADYNYFVFRKYKVTNKI